MSDFDIKDLRRALGTFATGVTVVTTIDSEGQPRGFTANSFTSVSLEPALILVCVAKAAAGYSVFSQTARFAINVLAESQQDISANFAAKDIERFTTVKWDAGKNGSPLIDGVVAWFECEKHETIDAGDHIVLIGRVVDYQYTTKTPIGYCRGAYVTFGLTEAAIKASEQEGPTRVSAIIENNAAIYLVCDDKTGLYSLPASTRLGGAEDEDSLIGKLSKAGITAGLSFLFSVYENPQTGEHNIVYRGEARSVDAEVVGEFIPFGQLPLDRLESEQVRSMIARYVRERQEDTFGVYVGGVDAGKVETLAKDWDDSSHMQGW